MSWKPWNTVVTKKRPQPPDMRPIETRVRELLDAGYDAVEIVEEIGADKVSRGKIAEVATLARLDRRNEVAPHLPPPRR